MFSYLESKDEIAKAQRKLEIALKRDFPTVATKDIGYPGGRERSAKVHTNGRYWFRAADYRINTPRRLNWFGRFGEAPGTSISVEINVAYTGRSDQAAGFFGRDNSTGRIYLLHSGRVGGGQKGVGKDAFCAWANEPLVEVFDARGRCRRGLIVMPVEGKDAGQAAVHYVALVDRFKLAVRAGEINTSAFRSTQKKFRDYYDESSGRRTGKRNSEIDYVSRHGEIVTALHSWRKTKAVPKNGQFVKNVLIDLGISVNGNLAEVFEVKPSADRQSVYTAIGQLLVHGDSESCRRVIVLPESERILDDQAKTLDRLNIDLVKFKLTSKKVTIV